MQLSMLSPRGGEGGGPRADVEHLTSIAFPILGNLTKNLGPRVGTFAFLRGGIGTKSNRSGADEVSTSFYIHTKTLLLTTHFQYKLMEHLTLRGLCGLLITSTCLSSENQALELY